MRAACFGSPLFSFCSVFVGIPVADDETIFFRHGERISCRYLPSSKFVGDTVKMKIVRDKKPLEVSFQLQSRRHIVPAHLYDTHPSYYITGGLVFTNLSRPYLRDAYGAKWYKQSSVELINQAYFGTLEHADQQVLILSSIMVDDINTGYGSAFHNIILVSINGRKPRNMRELVDICESEEKGQSHAAAAVLQHVFFCHADVCPSSLCSAGAAYLRFDFTLSRLIVLETSLIADATARVLAEKKIEFDRSIDLRQTRKNATETIAIADAPAHANGNGTSASTS